MDDISRCLDCKKNHGKIYRISQKPNPDPPIHIFCRCKIKVMDSIISGTATIFKKNGADWVIKNERKLPSNYLTVVEAKEYGWEPGKSLSEYVHDKLLF